MAKKAENTVQKLEFAVVEVTGNQYLVEVDKTYTVKKMDGVKGDKVTLDKVLMYVDGENVKTGKPFLADVTVEAEIASQTKGEKVDSLRYIAKSRLRKRSGSRSLLTKLTIKKIVSKSK